MNLAIISHPDCALHENSPMHPESPQRISAINDALISARLDPLLSHYDAPLATREQLERVHAPAYIDAIFAQAPDRGSIWLDGDTGMNPHSLSAALHAAGALVLATEWVTGDGPKRAFCNIRPPGHHAERSRAMGFCIFNNIAVGVTHALATQGLERVAICDFDVHHGNGTEDIFAGNDQVLVCQTFQHPLYPGTGMDSTAANLVNVPLSAGDGGDAFRAAVTDRWLPALEAFAPEMIFVSAGFDAHRDDPLAQLALVEADYAWVTRELVGVADRFAEGRIVSTLEGGYDLPALGRSAAAHVDALL